MTSSQPQGAATQFGDEVDGIMSAPLAGLVGTQAERLIRMAHEAVRMRVESARTDGVTIREGSMASNAAGTVH